MATAECVAVKGQWVFSICKYCLLFEQPSNENASGHTPAGLFL